MKFSGILVSVVLSAMLILVGCGGRLGRNSPVQVRLESVAGGQVLQDVKLIVSPNGGDADSFAAVSVTQPQAWAQITSADSFQEIDFTSTSQRIPYNVHIRNGSTAQVEARLRVFVEGDQVINTIATIPAGATQHRATIYRNNASQPSG